MKSARRHLRTAGYFILPGVVIALVSCSFLGGKPALPQSEAGAASLDTSPPDQFAGGIASAGIIYCSAGNSEPSRSSISKLASALQKTGDPYTIGWEMLDREEQPTLDRLTNSTVSPKEIARELTWQVPSFEGSWYPEILAELVRPEIAQVALGCPKSLLAKVRRGEPLTERESDLIPHGFTAPPADYDHFIEHLSATQMDRRDEAAALYRAHLFAEQVVADKIVAVARTQPQNKLLVFLRHENLSDPYGVPFFVKQKLHSRQLILEGKPGSVSGHGMLLTFVNRARRERFF